MGSANTARTNYIESCTIVSNQAGTTSVCVGLALSGDSAKLDRVYNTIIISNRTSAGAVSDIYCTNAVISNRFFNCLVMSNLPAAQGNIAAQPQFENFAARDMRLRLGSPGIDMGSNQTWMADAVDLNGLKRVMGFTRRVDMGCYETLPPSGTILCVH